MFTLQIDASTIQIDVYTVESDDSPFQTLKKLPSF
jgi:hypothetical protein